MNLAFTFSEDDFVQACGDVIAGTSSSIYSGLQEVVDSFVVSKYCSHPGIGEVRHYHDYHFSYKEARSLQDYIEDGYFEFFRYTFAISHNKEMPYFSVLIFPSCLSTNISEWSNWEYGAYENIEIANVLLKTKRKTTFKIIRLRILPRVLCEIQKAALEKWDHALTPSHCGAWEWRQTFFDKITGDVYFCSCFEKVVSEYGRGDINRCHSRHVLKALDNPRYRDGICHICSQAPSELEYTSTMYANNVVVRYGPYIKKTALELNVSKKEAEEIVREQVGMQRGKDWVQETLLFKIVKNLFQGHQVMREASPDWLKGQRLDVYVPALDLAIEYQGVQHFKPVEYFGGEDSFRKTQQRDKDKKQKCQDANVDLVYFLHSERLTESLVRERLKDYL